MGTCWGGWVTMEASLDTDKVAGGISYHPSLMANETSERISVPLNEIGQKIKSP